MRYVAELAERLADSPLPQGGHDHNGLCACELRRGDGVLQLHHIPLAEQPALFAKLARWLRPGGLLLACLGTGGSNDDVEHWLGVPMFFASHDQDANRRHLADAGFSLLIDEVISTEGPLGRETWQWVLAAATGARPWRGAEGLRRSQKGKPLL